MGPEYLVAGAAIGGAAVVLVAAYAGWHVRGKLADAMDALLRDEIEELKGQLQAMRRQRQAQANAGQRLLDAAARRGAATSDPDGLQRLLLDPDSPATAPPGEAGGGDSGEAGP